MDLSAMFLPWETNKEGCAGRGDGQKAVESAENTAEGQPEKRRRRPGRPAGSETRTPTAGCAAHRRQRLLVIRAASPSTEP